MKEKHEDNFKKFIGSWSGVTGGLPDNKQKLWFVGIEYGGKVGDIKTCREYRLSDIAGWTENFKYRNPDFYKWQYHQKISKIITAYKIEGEFRQDFYDKAWRKYIRDELYVIGDDGNANEFHVNLYPLSRPNINTCLDSALEKFGITQKEYYEYCQYTRFPFLRAQADYFSPQNIVCTGFQLEKQFAETFADAAGYDGREVLDVAGRKVIYYPCERWDLIVTPFLGGRFGLNSNQHLIELGNFLKNGRDSVACGRHL